MTGLGPIWLDPIWYTPAGGGCGRELAQVVEQGRLLVGSMMRASTSWKTSSPSAAPFETQHLVGMLKGGQQAALPPWRDRQRPSCRAAWRPGPSRVRPALPPSADRLQPLAPPVRPRHASTDALDVTRPPPRRAHDLHRRPTRPSLNRPHIRRNHATLRAPLVRKSAHCTTQNRRSARYVFLERAIVSQVYEPTVPVVRKSASVKPGTRRSARYAPRESTILSQLRSLAAARSAL